MPSWHASVSTVKGSLKLGKANTRVLVMATLRSSKVHCVVGFQANCLSLRMAVKGFVMSP